MTSHQIQIILFDFQNCQAESDIWMKCVFQVPAWAQHMSNPLRSIYLTNQQGQILFISSNCKIIATVRFSHIWPESDYCGCQAQSDRER
jgi:hypothetical protein